MTKGKGKTFGLGAIIYTNALLFLGLFIIMFGFVFVILFTHGSLGWSLHTWQEALVPGVAFVGILSFIIMTWLYNKVMGQTFGKKGKIRSGMGLGLPSRPGFLKRGKTTRAAELAYAAESAARRRGSSGVGIPDISKMRSSPTGRMRAAKKRQAAGG